MICALMVRTRRPSYIEYPDLKASNKGSKAFNPCAVFVIVKSFSEASSTARSDSGSGGSATKAAKKSVPRLYIA
jgi:hypothetical protein